MKSAVSALALGLLLACASSSQSSGPNVTLQLQPINQPTDVFYFSGPINLQYRLVINNPTDQALTLTRLDLRTIGPGAYSLRTTATPMNLKVAPNSATVYTISVWGYSRGGYLASTGPVTLQGTAYFKGRSDGFVRIFNQNISPLAGAWVQSLSRAGVAQLVESELPKLKVAGSSPVARSNLFIDAQA